MATRFLMRFHRFHQVPLGCSRGAADEDQVAANLLGRFRQAGGSFRALAGRIDQGNMYRSLA